MAGLLIFQHLKEVLAARRDADREVKKGRDPAAACKLTEG